jgi:sterol desaturase/sphingolipid hydroxylase (fatty acid hydroxylase superfamily)
MELNAVNLAAQRLMPFILLTFVVSICLEMLVAKLWARKLYDFDDTLHNLVMFFANRMMGGLGGAFMLAMLLGAERFIPWKLSGVTEAVVTFLVVDFLYYLQHRLFHTDTLFSPFHEIHHTSEQYNLTTTLRASVFLPFINPLFYVPAVLFGCSAFGIIISFALIQVYQLFLHTQLVPSMGPLEGIINTPSAHRVHHGNKRSQYESNLGGVLVIWDRLFGTYLSEGRNLVYGIKGVKPEKNYFVAQVKPFVAFANRFIKRLNTHISE